MVNIPRRPIVALLTDFGLCNGYVGAIKGVILKISPEVEIIDVAHNVSRQDVRAGAYVLASVVPYFPDDTIFLCVVDPGVGTARHIILLESEAGHCYIGPDNGLFSLVAEREGVARVVEISNPQYMLEEVTDTFQGRDIMAPAAAFLAKGIHPSELGSELKDFKRLKIDKPYVRDGVIVGEVIHIDNFGNAVTNIPVELLNKQNIFQRDMIEASLDSLKHSMVLGKTYADVDIGFPVAVIGSTRLLEISINQGDAAEELGLIVGMNIKVRGRT